MAKKYNGKDVTEWSLEDLKEEFKGGYEDGNHELNALNDMVNEKLLYIHKLKNEKNRLLLLEEMPNLMVLYKKREKIKKYGRRMKLKINTLKMLYARRHDKAFLDKLGKKLDVRIKKEAKKLEAKEKAFKDKQKKLENKKK